MKASVESLENVIKALSQFSYNKVEDKTLSGKAIEVSYSVKVENSTARIFQMPLQVVIHVRMNGVHAFTWGCVSNEENGQFLKWFLETKSKIQEAEYDAESKKKKEARTQFTEMMEEVAGQEA